MVVAARSAAEHTALRLLLHLGAHLVLQAGRLLEQPRLGPQPLAARPHVRSVTSRPHVQSQPDLVPDQSQPDLVPDPSQPDLMTGQSQPDLMTGQSQPDLMPDQSQLDLMLVRSQGWVAALISGGQAACRARV